MKTLHFPRHTFPVHTTWNVQTRLKSTVCSEVSATYSLTIDHSIKDIPLSLLGPTVDGTDGEGVACPQDQSRAAVILTGAHLVTGTGGGVMVH